MQLTTIFTMVLQTLYSRENINNLAIKGYIRLNLRTTVGSTKNMESNLFADFHILVILAFHAGVY